MGSCSGEKGGSIRSHKVGSVPSVERDHGKWTNTELIAPVLDGTQPMCKRASLGGKKPMNPKPVDSKPSKQAIVGSQPNMSCNKAFLRGASSKNRAFLGETLEQGKAQALNAF